MKRLSGILFLIFIALSLWNCERENVAGKSSLVIEGWIDSGENPEVMVTFSATASESIKTQKDRDKFVPRDCKVTVTDLGTMREYMLTPRDAEGYLPPRVYSTNELIGVVGGSYRLSVDVGNRHAEAVTTIPEPHKLDKFTFNYTDNADTSVFLSAWITDRPGSKDYYKLFIREVGVDSTFVPCIIGLINDETMPVGVSSRIPIYGPMVVGYSDIRKSFSVKSTVRMKLRTMDKDSYNYWRDFEQITTFASNPFVSVSYNLRSNIKGGFGYWSGYGATEYSFRVSE